MTDEGRADNAAFTPAEETASAADSAPKPKAAAAKPKRKRAARPRKAAPPAAAHPAAPSGGTPTLAELMLSSNGEDFEALSRNLAEAVTRANAVFASALQQPPAAAGAFRVDPFDAQSA
ncbi:MAG TPA: hypothetical protein VG983_11270, partial [Caulobacterales bacterium]|nr:hypothetical protein [Caulobacterales bacterium]